MSNTLINCAIIVCLLFTKEAIAQDFLLQGCYWDCPESSSAEIDEASLHYWTQKIQSQAAELGHTGFSYIWLPTSTTKTVETSGLINNLNNVGIQTISDLQLSTDKDTSSTKRNDQFIDLLAKKSEVNSYQLRADSNLNPPQIGALLNHFCNEEATPNLFITSPPKQGLSASASANWINAIEQAMNEEANRQIDPKVQDFILREALRQACSDPDYDLRTIYQSSLRDATSLSAYNLISLVNSPLFRNQNGIAGDADDPIKDPMLAYAYTLTNNQLGLPAIFYADYYGNEAAIDLYLDQQALKPIIDQLMKVHKQYIHQSTRVEYLNHFETEKSSHYLSAEKGADASSTLIYQIDGTNTLAGQANTPKGKRDVIVAINFATDTLQLIQEINSAYVNAGDYFTDILGFSNEENTAVKFDSEFHIPNSIYIELPPRSFSIWVQGTAKPVLASAIEFNAVPYDDFIELSWDIPSEKEIRGYEVQRASNNSVFEKIQWIEAASLGNEGASYLHIDNSFAYNTTLHYRIKLVNKAGGFEYSSTEELLLAKEEVECELSEGTKEGTKSIRVKSNIEEAANIVVFNAEGDRVLAEKHFIHKGKTEKEIDLNQLPSGVYFLNFSTEGSYTWSEKILKF